jgi:hypothetical protein
MHNKKEPVADVRFIKKTHAGNGLFRYPTHGGAGPVRYPRITRGIRTQQLPR